MIFWIKQRTRRKRFRNREIRRNVFFVPQKSNPSNGNSKGKAKQDAGAILKEGRVGTSWFPSPSRPRTNSDYAQGVGGATLELHQPVEVHFVELVGTRHYPEWTKIRVREPSPSSHKDNLIAESQPSGRIPFRPPELTPGRSNFPSTSARNWQRTLFPPVSDQETFGEAPNNNQLETPESSNNLQEVQDGVGQNSDPSDRTGLGDGYSGSEGRLLPRPNPSRIPEVPKIRNISGSGDSTLPVQLPFLRNRLSSQSLYKDHDRSHYIHPSSGDLHSTLSRRSTHCRSLSLPPQSRLNKISRNPKVVGLDPKSREIGPSSLQEEEVPRSPSGLRGEEFLSAQRTSTRSGTEDNSIQNPEGSYSTRVHVYTGISNILYPDGTLGSSPHESPPNPYPIILGRTAEFSLQENLPSQSCQNIPDMVATAPKPPTGGQLGSNPAKDTNIRCQSKGMGSYSRGILFPGHLGPRHQSKLFKLQRTESGGRSIKSCILHCSGTPCQNIFRQYDHGSIPSSSRRHKIQETKNLSLKHFFLGREARPLYFSSSPEGVSQYPGRFPEQKGCTSRGMVSGPGGLSLPDFQMGDPRGRPFCQQSECQAANLFLPKYDRQSSGHGCVLSPVEVQPRLCISSDPIAIKNSTEDPIGTSYGDSNRTNMAREELVQRPVRHGPGRSNMSTSEGKSSSSGTVAASKPSQIESFSMASEAEILKARGLSDGVIHTLQNSRKPITNAIYAKTWKKFSSWYLPDIPDPFHPNIAKILDFLQKGLELGLRPNTLKVQISALGSYFDQELAKHRWIRRFVTSASRIRPRVLNNTPPWDLNLVLNSLTRDPFEPLSQSSLKVLTLKTVFLVAITSARRIGELHALSIQEPYLRVTSDNIILRLDPTFLPKVTSDFHRGQDIVLPSFYPDPSNIKEESFHTLDVRRVVLHYLSQTESWRIDQNLFIQLSGKNKGRKATKNTIANWIKQAISLAYSSQNLPPPPSLKAHSTRSVSTSWAERGRGDLLQYRCRGRFLETELTHVNSLCGFRSVLHLFLNRNPQVKSAQKNTGNPRKIRRRHAESCCANGVYITSGNGGVFPQVLPPGAMHCKALRSEYMKRFKDPEWEASCRSCYQEMLKYRLGRRMLEHAHNPWLWDGWDGSSGSSSGHSTPPTKAPEPCQPPHKLPPAGHPEDTAGASSQAAASDPLIQGVLICPVEGRADCSTLVCPQQGRYVHLHRSTISGAMKQAGGRYRKKKGCSGPRLATPLGPDHPAENNQDGEKATKSNEKSASNSRAQHTRSVPTKQNVHKADTSPQRMSLTKEIRHPFALYASDIRVLQDTAVDMDIQALCSSMDNLVVNVQKIQDTIDQKSMLEPRIPIPDLFFGDRTKFLSFRNNCKLFLALKPHSSGNPIQQVLIIISFLRGDPQDWAFSLAPGDSALSNVDAFFQALGLLYDEPNSVDQAEKNLLALCQGQDDVEVYCQKFRKWSVLTLWNESALAALFRKGLSEALKDVMVGFPMPAGLNESMSLAIQIGRHLRERKSVHHLAVLSESKPEPMQCDRTMTKVERQEHRRLNRLCFYCGDSTHAISNCPKRTRRFDSSAVIGTVQSKFLLSITLMCSLSSYSVMAFVDSGAALNLMDLDYARRCGFFLEPLRCPIPLRGIDATPLAKNKPQYWAQLTMCMAPAHQEVIRFLIHEAALRAKNRRQKERKRHLLQKQRARSADAERVLRRKPSPVDNPWMTEYMRCYSARAR
ncbi:unnamed protein product [Ranitomeya imitator]|uniref:Retrotransposon gag domain-containing protein n=1 Tax=Ranitomeya imitator TaxID=111125 RepID=A0ABN9LTY1_9NEOB|nr:unnamed protein product [Ranitomeya imitator]